MLLGSVLNKYSCTSALDLVLGAEFASLRITICLLMITSPDYPKLLQYLVYLCTKCYIRQSIASESIIKNTPADVGISQGF